MDLLRFLIGLQQVGKFPSLPGGMPDRLAFLLRVLSAFEAI